MKKYKNNETIVVLGASFNGVKEMIEHARKRMPRMVCMWVKIHNFILALTARTICMRIAILPIWFLLKA